MRDCKGRLALCRGSGNAVRGTVCWGPEKLLFLFLLAASGGEQKEYKSKRAMRITIITIGSYGDVQPYIALGQGLQTAGHNVSLATHTRFKPSICSHGLDFFPVAGDPSAILESEAGRAWLDSGNNPLHFFHRLSTLAEPLLRQAALDCWNACQNAGAILLAQLGIGVAYPVIESLGVPYYFACLQPLTPTCAFPCPFFPAKPSWLPIDTGYYNRLTYFLSVEAFWKLARSSINKIRRESLNLPRLPFRWLVDQLRRQDKHFLYGYSSNVLSPAADWNDRNHITGYWFLDRSADWQPPTDLVDFLASGPAPVYVGFGSMNNRNPEEVTEVVLKALACSRQRGILLTGWGGLSNADLPDEVFKIDAIPHDWLFPQMAAVVHHGGAGTTAAGLRAGIPSVIIPFFAEQPFWGLRIAGLGVGPKPIPRKQLSVERLAAAIHTAVSDEDMRGRAHALGASIRAENGVAQAVQVFHSCLQSK